MNEIKISASFKDRTLKQEGINLVSGDFNSTKVVFEFDKEYSGTMVFEIANPKGELVFADTIVNNEIILTAKTEVKDTYDYIQYLDNENNIYWYDSENDIIYNSEYEIVEITLEQLTKVLVNVSIFDSEGEYPFEITLYDGESKLTSMPDVFVVLQEKVLIEDKFVEPYLPVFDQLMQELNTATEAANNLDIDVEKEDKVATVTITKKDGTIKSVEIYDGEGGGGGTGDYEELENKPSINGVELIGNKTTANLGLFSGNYNDLSNKPTIPTVPTDVSAFNNDADYQTGTDVSTAVGAETTNRQTADTALQSQIDALSNANDVVDVLATYQDLLDYDTTHLKNNDIIKVMTDSSHSNAISYFKWVITDNVGAWSYVGSQGPFYTKSETDTLLNAKANTTDIPTELADLAGDSTHRTVTDAEKTTWNGKQDELVSGTNIKTINNQSILGSGNLAISETHSLGTIGNYTMSNRLNINNLDVGVYYLLGNETTSGETLYLSGTYKGTTKTHNITNAKTLVGGLWVLKIINKLEDTIPTNTNICKLFYMSIHPISKQLTSTILTIYIRDNVLFFNVSNFELTNYVDKTLAETISGKKTFTVLPESSVTPTTDNQLVNKKYVDDTVGDINTALEAIINGGA